MFKSYCLKANAETMAAIEKLTPTKADFFELDCEPSAIIARPECEIPTRYVNDRDGVPCELATTPFYAHAAVEAKRADYEVPRLIVMWMTEYLVNPDVMKREGEVEKARASGETFVAVTVIGGDRGPVTVTRNLMNYQVENSEYTWDNLIGQASRAMADKAKACRRILIRD